MNTSFLSGLFRPPAHCGTGGFGISIFGWLGLLLAAVLAAGCAHERDSAGQLSGPRGYISPEPPTFMSGPLGVVLTNMGGFGARVVMQTTPTLGPPEILSGQLLGRETKLLFEPDDSHIVDKRFRSAGICFVWDVAENRGLMLCEALQAWAPISFSVRVTNAVASPAVARLETIAGHRCNETLVTTSSSDASTGTFRVWRAADLKDFPLRITTVTNPTPRTLQFSNVRLEIPKGGLFNPPPAFTRYDNADTMMGELLLRRQNLKRPVTGGWTESVPMAPPQQGGPR